MERLGYMSRVYTQIHMIAGQAYYDLAMVQGGMINVGRRLLSQLSARERSVSDMD